MNSRSLLPEAQQCVSGHMQDLAGAGFPVSICYADERAGTLVAGIPRYRPELAGQYRVLLGELIGDTPVRFTAWGLARRHAEKNQHNRPVIGGLLINAAISPGNSEQGTVCVAADRGGQLGYVTAGHSAGKVGRRVYQPNRPPNTTKIGTTTVISAFETRAYSDSAFLSDNTNGNLTRNRIWKTTGTQYTVTGVTAPAMGDTVYMQGAEDPGERQGLVAVTSATVTFEDGGILDDQYLANYLSLSGDSGAPVYVKDADPNVRLVGLNVGACAPGDANPTPNQHTYPPASGTYAIISKWARIEADLGVTR